MIGLVVINADDQRIIKIKGKILIMLKNAAKYDELPQYSISTKLILDNLLIVASHQIKYL